MNRKLWYLKQLNLFKTLPEKEVELISEHFVEATTDSFVCVVPKQGFFDMVSKNPAIANTLVRELFTKVIESEKQVAALASDNLLIKVKNLLARLAKKYGEIKDDRVVIPTKFTHEQLADMVGVSRPTPQLI